MPYLIFDTNENEVVRDRSTVSIICKNLHIFSSVPFIEYEQHNLLRISISLNYLLDELKIIE